MRRCTCFFFFFNDTATTEIYTLSLHDALPICHRNRRRPRRGHPRREGAGRPRRSEEHTSELQSPCNLVCRLLLEKKKSALPQRLGSSTSVAPPARTTPTACSPSFRDLPWGSRR